MNIAKETASSIEEYVKIINDFISTRKRKDKEVHFYFRGEKDYGETALAPFIYRKGLLKKEHIFYREMMRFNDSDFEKDKTAIDRLCRMQHFGCPTRMLDLCEDCFAALYFAIEKREPGETAFVYLFTIPEDKIRYYDSDTATILANLAKLPLNKEGRGIYGDKSKKELFERTKQIVNNRMSVNEYNDKFLGFLLHEIKEDKPYMLSLINLGDIFSVQCVKTKLNNDRIFAQKGAFLLFGLNVHDVEKPIPLDGSYEKPNYWREDFGWDGVPIEEMLKIRIESGISLDNLEYLGISKPYIYPNMEKIAEHLINRFTKNGC